MQGNLFDALVLNNRILLDLFKNIKQHNTGAISSVQ